MPAELLPLLQDWGPYGTIAVLIAMFLFDRLGVRKGDKDMKENHIPHMEANLALLTELLQSQATQHAQMIDRLDNIWTEIRK